MREFHLILRFFILSSKPFGKLGDIHDNIGWSTVSLSGGVSDQKKGMSSRGYLDSWYIDPAWYIVTYKYTHTPRPEQLSF